MTKVLVIEDERYLLEDITELLQYTDFEVQGANSGSQGLQVANEYEPDLIICDIMMPDLDGYQVLEQIRGNPETADTPFIFLTAKADRDSMRYGMDMGADDYLTKPFTSAELLTAINTRLKRQSQITVGSEEKLEAIKRQLTRMVTHELRTPLISINTVVDVITRSIGKLSEDEIQEMLDTISVGSKVLNHRVEQLVYITQLEAGVISHEVIVENGLPMRLWEMVVSAGNLARRFSYDQQHKNVSVKLYDHDRDSVVMCNPPALKQAFAELISNATAFAPPNSQVNISQWRSGNRALFSIVDEGPGIPEDRLAEALRDFSQIDRETKEQQGMGMGLSLAYRIVEAHSGTIDILSIVGKGTQVTVSLPIVTM